MFGKHWPIGSLGEINRLLCYMRTSEKLLYIDISYAASEGVPGESRKRQLKKAVVSSIEAIGFFPSRTLKKRAVGAVITVTESIIPAVILCCW